MTPFLWLLFPTYADCPRENTPAWPGKLINPWFICACWISTWHGKQPRLRIRPTILIDSSNKKLSVLGFTENQFILSPSKSPGTAGANWSGGSGSKTLITGTKEADYVHWKRQLKHRRLKFKISACLLPFGFSLIAAFIIRYLPFYF